MTAINFMQCITIFLNDANLALFLQFQYKYNDSDALHGPTSHLHHQNACHVFLAFISSPLQAQVPLSSPTTVGDHLLTC